MESVSQPVTADGKDAGSTRARRSSCAGGSQNSVKNGVHFERARKPRGAHLTHPSLTLTLLARCEVLKRHGVGERESEPGADFGSLRLPSCRIPVPITPGTRPNVPAQFTVVTLLWRPFTPSESTRSCLPSAPFLKNWYLMPILTTMLSLRHLRNLNGRKKLDTL